MKHKLKIISGVLTAIALLGSSMTAFAEDDIDYNYWAYGLFDNDIFTVKNDAFTYTTGLHGITLENELTDANFMVSGIARRTDGSIDYLVLTSVNMVTQGGERHIGSAENLCENEISGSYHVEDIRIGDLFKFDDYISTAGIPSQIGIEGNVVYKGYGQDIFGKEFQKVIRHEWISEPACFWHASDGGFDAGFDIVMGDATEDEKVDILDVISINKTILGKQSLNHYSKLATDINKNGNLDSSDSLAIMKYIVGIIDVLSE